MLKLLLIGNLGADAEIRDHNGRQFIAFRVAHTDKRVSPDGVVTESTIWASCLYNRVHMKLLPFLKKGQKVYVSGPLSVRTFLSPKTRQWESGLNVLVDDLELCGASSFNESVAPQEQKTPQDSEVSSDMPF